MKRNYNFLLILIFFLSGCIASYEKKDYIIINDEKIALEISTSDEEIEKGLSGRTKLAEKKGMLFVFEDYQIRSFWMKDMLFPIDIVWIKDQEVVGIEKNIKPSAENGLIIYNSPLPVNYVLELNAGVSDKKNIKKGDYLNIKLKK